MDKKDKNSKENITPEEKLFRVISGSKSFPLDPSEFQEEEILEHGLTEKMENWFQKIQQGFREAAFGIERSLRRGSSLGAPSAALPIPPAADFFQIKAVNRILLFVVLFLLGYLVMDAIFYRAVRMGFSGLGPESRREDRAVSSVPLPPREDLARYLQGAARRNVFQPGAAPAASAAAPASEASNPAPPNFKLLGISWDAEEFVAMIQHDPNQEGVAFVRAGDTVGGLRVESVKEYSVTLSDGSQKWELT